MIWTTEDNQPTNPRVNQPWLRLWQARERESVGRERFTAKYVANLSIWKRYNWQPRAAEQMLKWIETGEWDLEKGIVLT